MAEAGVLAPLVSALRDLVAWCESERVAMAVIGGVAASIHGRPRTTKDVDALVILEGARRDAFLAAGRAFGFVPRIPDALAFAKRSQVLLLRHEASAIDVDVAFGGLPFEVDAVARARSRRIAEVSIPLVRPEDLVVMKAVAHRARDLADIEAVLESNPDLDSREVRAVVREFARVLEMPEILADLERVLGPRRARRRKRSARARKIKRR